MHERAQKSIAWHGVALLNRQQANLGLLKRDAYSRSDLRTLYALKLLYQRCITERFTADMEDVNSSA
jgi:hypothetical protein